MKATAYVLSIFDHEVSKVDQRKINARRLSLSEKTRLTQKACAEFCSIGSGPKKVPSGVLYTIRRQSDGAVIPIIESPDNPPLLRKRRKVQKS